MDGIHDQGVLDRDEAAQPAVAPLQLLHDEAVAHRFQAGAVVTGQAGPEVAEARHGLDQLQRKRAGLEMVFDDGQDPFFDERTNAVSNQSFLLRQQVVETHEIHVFRHGDEYSRLRRAPGGWAGCETGNSESPESLPICRSPVCYKGFVIIGLTGRNGSGKGVVADYLQTKGFGFWSLSDVIRDEITRQGAEVTRPRLIHVGRELRSKYGNDHLAQEILSKLHADRNYVVDSFRHPSEVRAFSRQPDFYLVAVEADVEVRHQRVCARARENDPVTLERFLELERQELSSPDTQGQQLLATGRLANVSFANNGTKQDLRSKVAEWLQQTAPKMTRPGWDPYFMKLAQVVALRSNCIKRKVGAIIVRDLRVISTGYNGTPRGTRNCFRGGLPALRRTGGQRHATGRLPLFPCRGECHHAGGLPWGQRERGRSVYDLLPLPDLQQDDHQLGGERGGLQPGVSAFREIVSAPPGGVGGVPPVDRGRGRARRRRSQRCDLRSERSASCSRGLCRTEYGSPSGFHNRSGKPSNWVRA